MKKLSDNKKFRKVFYWFNLFSGFLGYVIVYNLITPTTPLEETLSTVVQIGCLLLSLICLTGLLVQSVTDLFKGEKSNTESERRFWDFSYAHRFLKEHRNDIQLFELRMYHDRDVGETFVENGVLVKALNGGDYQQFCSALDGVQCTCVDIPSIHVVYKGGAEEWIACYESLADNFANSHRKLEPL